MAGLPGLSGLHRARDQTALVPEAEDNDVSHRLGSWSVERMPEATLAVPLPSQWRCLQALYHHTEQMFRRIDLSEHPPSRDTYLTVLRHAVSGRADYKHALV